MKITICSSAFFARESYELKKKLEEEGHVVFIYPKEVEISGRSVPIEEFYEMRKKELTEGLLEVKARLIEEHIKRIERSDAILVLNLDKKGKEGYIGGNTFMEIAIAFYLGKKIFLWKEPSKDLPYYEEIMTMKPIIIRGDVKKVY
ncbi:hypothetical protein DRN62_00220 [Nanoarchaeota archaeon]|nr:MAG: hypothetical protein DRN62_00220 [Nanoarchaeota archaeon]